MLLKRFPPVVRYIFVICCLIVVIGDFVIALKLCLPNIPAGLTRHGGENVLPRPVQTAIKGLRQLDVGRFSCFGQLASDPTLNVGVIEGAWPIRFTRNCAVAVAFTKDIDPSGKFRVLWEEDGVGIIEYIK